MLHVIYVERKSKECLSSQNESPKTPEKRTLRNGMVIMSGIPNISGKRKSEQSNNNNNNGSQMSKMIENIASSVNDLRGRFLSMEKRTIELESITNANDLKRWHHIRTLMVTLILMKAFKLMRIWKH